MICIIALILICCILHRRKMRAQLLKIEKELYALLCSGISRIL